MCEKVALGAYGIRKSFREADGSSLPILKGIDLEVGQGESLAITGNSGSGKSTLLEILGTLLPPDAGEVRIQGRPVSGMKARDLARIRNETLGFVFQNSMLLGDFTALENVMMPGLIKGMPYDEAKRRAGALLDAVGLSSRASHARDTLSGGERQRIAVARSLMNHPIVVLADEPTGSLDEKNARMVEDLLLALVAKEGTSLVLVTHNPGFAARCGRVAVLRDGVLA